MRKTELFGLDGARDPVDLRDGTAPAPGRRRWLPVGLGLTAAALVVAVAVSAATAATSSPAARSEPPATTATARSTTTTTAPPPSAQAAATPTVPADVAARERAELTETAALLTTPVILNSPDEWDQWLPAGKPYPGPSTAADIATCPRLAAGLSAALGVQMSYWTGTLPNGPVGCDWATVPLSYGPDPSDYAYFLAVGYLADGTTVEVARHRNYEHQGAICPDVDVPAVAPGAVLVRCENDTTSLVLMLPDQRRNGVWFLQADTRGNADHPASYALTSLIDGVVAAYG